MEIEVEMPIFDGEAPETDNEEGTSVSLKNDCLVVDVSNKVHCLEITGEDAESDDDEKYLDNEHNKSQEITERISLSSFDSTAVTSMVELNATKIIDKRNQSLLHFKLRESNSSFYYDVEGVLREFVKENEKSLTEIDQCISKSQTLLQSASPTLRNLEVQSNSLQNKLITLLTSNFLSNVTITK